MNGTWKVTGGRGGGAAVRLGAGAVAAALILSWLATVLWLIAIALGVVLVVVAAGVVVLVRRNPADAAAFARQADALRAQSAPQAIAGQPAVVIHYHGGTHLHVEPGADAAAILRQADRAVIAGVRAEPQANPARSPLTREER